MPPIFSSNFLYIIQIPNYECSHVKMLKVNYLYSFGDFFSLSCMFGKLPSSPLLILYFIRNMNSYGDVHTQESRAYFIKDFAIHSEVKY
jgi:hypothetical protein